MPPSRRGQERHRGRWGSLTYDKVAPAVHAWVESAVGGRLHVAQEHLGGMSPGCATTLRTPTGDACFVKAVSEKANEQTASLFRYESRILMGLPAAAYRPRLLGTFDDGEWVALLLTHIDGNHPDMTNPDDVEAVESVVLQQIEELTPPPEGLDAVPLSVTVERWQARWRDIADDPTRFLPSWAVPRLPLLLERVSRLAVEVPPSAVCHFDIRDDNLLIAPDGTARILDWGMTRLGPRWTDLAVLAVQLPTPDAAATFMQRHLPESDQEAVTDFLVTFGGSQAWNAKQPAPQGLPTFTAYCQSDSERLLSLARLRLGLTPPG